MWWDSKDFTNVLKIFEIGHISRVDGPNKRVVIFLQGCHLKCPWCHSPHAQPCTSPLLFYKERCIGCRRCEEVCPNGVHIFQGGEHTLERAPCRACGACIDACSHSRRGVSGSVLHLPTRAVTPEELFSEIQPYLRLCGKEGGITLSGGEALLQLESIREFLLLCKEGGIHTAVETSGVLDISYYEAVLDLVDLWLFGIRIWGKTGDEKNEVKKILQENLDLLVKKHHKRVLPRLPMVPDVLDQEEVLEATKELLEDVGIQEICLSPWNAYYETYYLAAGISLSQIPPTPESVKRSEDIIKTYFQQRHFSIFNNERK